MRFLGRSLLALFLLGGTLGILAVAFDSVHSALRDRASREPHNRVQRERTCAVKVVPAEVGSVRPRIGAFGEIRRRRTLKLRAPIGSTIPELSPNSVEGGVLSRGETVLRTDASDAEAALQFAPADRNDTESEAKVAVRLYRTAENSGFN